MRAHRRCENVVRMTDRLHLSLALEPASDPIKGSLRAQHGEQREFQGWMEFAAVLQALIDVDGDDPRSDRRPC